MATKTILLSIVPLFIIVYFSNAYIQDAFQDRFDSTVAAPYFESVKKYFIVLDHVANQLGNLEPNSVVPETVNEELIQATGVFLTKLTSAAVSSKAIHEWAEYELSTQIQKIKNTTNKLNANMDERFLLKSKLDSRDHKVKEINAQVKNLNGTVNARLHRVRYLEHKFYQARHRCMAKTQRRKRNVGKSIGDFFKGAFIKVAEGFMAVPDLAHKAGDGIYRGFCEFLNLFTKRIWTAQTKLEAAEKDLKRTINELNEAKVEASYLRSNLDRLNNAKEALDSEIPKLDARKVQLRITLNEIVMLENKMKQCVERLQLIKENAAAVHKVAKMGVLLDPTDIVNPLQEIGDLISANDVNRLLPRLNGEEVDRLRAKLDRLKI